MDIQTLASLIIVYALLSRLFTGIKRLRKPRRKNKRNFVRYFRSLPQEAQVAFMASLDQDGAEQLQYALLNDMDTHNQVARQFFEWANEAQNQNFIQNNQQEALKAVTPFDHGGYVQGPGFNPSDTMAHDQMNQQMNSMNDNF